MTSNYRITVFVNNICTCIYFTYTCQYYYKIHLLFCKGCSNTKINNTAENKIIHGSEILIQQNLKLRNIMWNKVILSKPRDSHLQSVL